MVSIEEEQSQEDLQCLHQLPLLGFENVHGFMKLIWQFFCKERSNLTFRNCSLGHGCSALSA